MITLEQAILDVEKFQAPSLTPSPYLWSELKQAMLVDQISHFMDDNKQYLKDYNFGSPVYFKELIDPMLPKRENFVWIVLIPFTCDGKKDFAHFTFWEENKTFKGEW